MNIAILKNKLLNLYRKKYSALFVKSLSVRLGKLISTNRVPISPYEFKIYFSMDRLAFLKFLTDTLVFGIFELLWESTCPHCQTIIERKKNINLISEEQYCQHCDVHFHPHADENIVITLLPDRSFYKMPNSNPLSTVNTQVRPMYAIELLSYPPFVELFGNYIPATEQNIRVRAVTIMFTDMERSTHLYNKIGDFRAFELVKKQFTDEFQIIINHDGGIIKTMGDAVFAVFPNAFTALTSAVDLHHHMCHLLREFHLQDQTGLKVGLVNGPALFVNLNDTLDLFGSSVNLASRVVNLASSGKIAVSQSIINDIEIERYLKKNAVASHKIESNLKGFPGSKDVFLIPVNNITNEKIQSRD